MPIQILLAAAAAFIFSGCEVKDPLYCDQNTPCTDPALPFCDLQGQYPASEGIKRTCIPDPFAGDAGPGECSSGSFIQCLDQGTASYCGEDGASSVSVSCEAGCDADVGCSCEPDSVSCEEDLAIHCGESGTIERIEECALGCHSSRERCLDVVPSNGLGEFFDDAANGPDVDIEDLSGAVTVIDTATGTIVLGDGSEVLVPSELVPAPAGGVPVRVFKVRSFRVRECTEVSAAINTPALAIVSQDEVVISCPVRIRCGEFDASACRGGPAVAGTGNGNDEGPHSGAGGGGFGSAGGGGGNSGGSVGGVGGGTSGNINLTPLRGGCPGGRDGPTAGNAAGGAIQIVSRAAIRLSATDMTYGVLDAGGSPGLGFAGPITTVSYGGGSGGGILLEAPIVEVVEGAALVANGGGGGASHCGSNGESGLRSTVQANGGTCPDDIGEGGDGAARDNALLLNGKNAANGFSGGGGGGGVGRIRINTVTDGLTIPEGAIISPAPSLGAIEVQ